MTRRDPSVAIVGAGMAGICMAITLLNSGITDVTIYEKADEVGGTWRENTYPGLVCDVPSWLYQYSFAKNPDWSNLFSPGGEIQSYFCGIADRYRLRDRIRFGTEIVSARFEDDHWSVVTDSGEETAVDFLIVATGLLHHVSALAGVAAKVTMFQRTPQWILPWPNRQYSKVSRACYRGAPWLESLAYKIWGRAFEQFTAALTRPGWHRRVTGMTCRASLRLVRDPHLRQALTPDYQPMCKRLVMSSGFYRAIQRDDVELVTTGIDRIENAGIVTDDGVLREVDVIVLATGFDSHAFFRPMKLIGRDGVEIDELWRGGPYAYQTVAMPGFPNFFMMLGPHSPVGNYPLTGIAESQADHILRWIQRWRSSEFDTVEPTSWATDEFNAKLRAAMPKTVWTTGCSSWYLNDDWVPEVWPFAPAEHRAMLANPDLDQYHLRCRPEVLAW